MGAIPKSRLLAIVLVIVGALICLVSVFADTLGLGGQSSAMGWKQWLGIVVGFTAALCGLGLFNRPMLVEASATASSWGGHLFLQLRDNWRLVLALGLLILILAVGFRLQIQAVANSMPYPRRVDEPNLTTRGSQILTTGDYNLHLFRYPYLPVHLLVASFVVGYVDAAAHLELRDTGDIGPLDYPYYTQPRMVWSAKILWTLLSLCTMVFMGVLAYKVYGNEFLLCLVPLLLLLSKIYFHSISRYLNIDIVGAFTVSLTYLYLFPTLERDSIWHKAIVPGVLCAMVISSKYTLLWISVPAVLAILLYSREKRILKVAIFGVSVVLAFWIINPFILSDLKQFLNDIAIVVSHYAEGHSGQTSEPGWPQLVKTGRSLVQDWGWGVTILALIGIAATIRRDWKHALILVSFPLLLVLYLSAQRAWFSRNIVSVFTFWALFAAIGIVAVWSVGEKLLRQVPPLRASARPRHLIVGMIVLFSLALMLPMERPAAWAKEKRDSRLRMIDWIPENIPPGSELVLPTELGVDVSPLIENYKVSVYPFMDLSLESFQSGLMLLDEPYVLMPTFGYDRRNESGRELAESLNSLGENLEVIHTFSGSKVLVNYQTPVPGGSPKISISRLVLTDEEQSKLLASREIDLLTLEGNKRQNPDGSLRLPWDTRLQSPPMVLKTGSYEIAFVTKGTPVKGINTLFRAYFGKDNLLGEFYSQETYEETRLLFEISESTEASLYVEFVNDGAEKDETGEIIADRVAHIQSITITKLD